MKSSELVEQLSKDMDVWLKNPKPEGTVIDKITLEGFILRWLIDNKHLVDAVARSAFRLRPRKNQVK
jgi:hypothetical protein